MAVSKMGTSSQEDKGMEDALCVLVICSEGDCQEKPDEMIGKCRLRADFCGNVSEARTRMAQQYVSVVFCSDTLPDTDLRDTLKEIRKLGPDAPVVIFSQLADWDAYLSVMGAGAFDYIACPLDCDETQRILLLAIEHSSGRSRLAQPTV